jgi:hypothetical protein
MKKLNLFSRRPHLLSAVLCLATVAPAFAGGPPGPDWNPVAPGAAGTIWEGASSVNHWFNVYGTDKTGNLIKPPIVRAVQAAVQVGGPRAGQIGAMINIPADPTGTRFDIKNRTFGSQAAAMANIRVSSDQGAGDGGGVLNVSACADLDLEAEYLGDDGNIHLEDTLGRAAIISSATGASLEIPDVYTAEVTPDANNMYTLYSWVDINEYSPTTSFTLGEDFDISNGTCSLLPGMLFSSTPFDFTGSTAPTLGNPDAFAADGVTGTPFTGDALTETLHGVPEPSTVALLGVSTLGLLAYEWRRRTAKA